MKKLIVLTLFCFVMIFLSAAQAACYYVRDGAYPIYQLPCFASLAAAEQYLKSDSAKGFQSPYPDTNSSLYVLDRVGFGSSGSTISKAYSYKYKTMAPTIDMGPTPDEASIVAGNQAFLNSIDPGNYYVLAGRAATGSVIRTGQDTDHRDTLFQSINVATYIAVRGNSTFFVTNGHYWKCLATHQGPQFAVTSLAQACIGVENGDILVDGEPVKSAASCEIGNPCHPQTGTKVQDEIDFAWEGIEFSRKYQSAIEASGSGPLGQSWSMPFDSSLRSNNQEFTIAINGVIDVYRKDGASPYYYSKNKPGDRIEDLSTGGALLVRGDGTSYFFPLASGGGGFKPLAWIYNKHTSRTLTLSYCAGSDGPSCAINRLKSVVSSSGRTLDFAYSDTTGVEAVSRLSMVAADGTPLATYSYDAMGRLESATTNRNGLPASRTYRYSENGSVCVNGSGVALTPCYIDSSASLLTSIADEEGVLYAFFRYDNIGRVVSSEHVNGADRIKLQYGSDSSTTVTTPSGATITYASTLKGYFSRLLSTTGALKGNYTYDAAGFLDNVTDPVGIVTDFDHDTAGRLVKVTRAKGRSEQFVESIEWDVAANETRLVSNGATRTVSAHNSRGQLVSVTETDLTGTPLVDRTTTLSYCEVADVAAVLCPAVGLLISIDGSRTDVSDIVRYDYYAADATDCASVPSGSCSYRKTDLRSVTNAAGHSQTFLAYDFAGRPISVRDSNGIITDFAYTNRGDISERTVRGNDPSTEVDDAKSVFVYNAVGLLKQVSLPGHGSVTFSYDASHRLSGVSDSVGNSLSFVLDSSGNRAREEIRDGAGSLSLTMTSVYNSLSQVGSLVDAYGKAVTYAYDARGLVDTVTDRLGKVTDSDVNAFGQVTRILANKNRKGLDQVLTTFQYDARGNLTGITDPKNLTSTFGYDGFEQLRVQSNVDTGVISYNYDEAGNPESRVDARGVRVEYRYDSINRLSAIEVPTASENAYFTYDVPSEACNGLEPNSIGRLAGFTDASGESMFCYNARGQTIRKVQALTGMTALTIEPTYNGASELIAVAYPSGAIVTYLRGADGRVTAVDAVPTAGGVQVTLVSDAQYLPFGPLRSITFGNGRRLTKSFDLNRNPDVVSDSTGAFSEDLTLNAIGQVIGVVEQVTATAIVSRAYEYDKHDRLTSRKSGSSVLEALKYDGTGNRTLKTVGSATSAYSYPTNSHRLATVGSISRTYTASGSVEQIGAGSSLKSFIYNDRNRLAEVRASGSLLARYIYNGLGERVLSLTDDPANSRQYLYDETGKMVGEYDLAGNRIQEFVWLDDQLIAILSDHAGSTYQYVQTDHLGSPRAVVKPATNTVVWRWNLTDSAFGESPPQQDPDGDGQIFRLDHRYPGQVFDPKSGIVYNRERDYEPETGRYLESDPIDFRGGVSTYGYVSADPLNYYDDAGLSKKSRVRTLGAGGNSHDRSVASANFMHRGTGIVPDYSRLYSDRSDSNFSKFRDMKTRLDEDNRLCTDLRCWQQAQAGVCSSYDRWVKMSYLPRNAIIGSAVNQMDNCICISWIGIEQVSYEPPPVDVSDAASVFGKAWRARQARLARPAARR